MEQFYHIFYFRKFKTYEVMIRVEVDEVKL